MLARKIGLGSRVVGERIAFLELELPFCGFAREITYAFGDETARFSTRKHRSAHDFENTHVIRPCLFSDMGKSRTEGWEIARRYSDRYPKGPPCLICAKPDCGDDGEEEEKRKERKKK